VFTEDVEDGWAACVALESEVGLDPADSATLAAPHSLQKREISTMDVPQFVQKHDIDDSFWTSDSSNLQAFDPNLRVFSVKPEDRNA
jgi:hypothetical protein